MWFLEVGLLVPETLSPPVPTFAVSVSVFCFVLAFCFGLVFSLSSTAPVLQPHPAELAPAVIYRLDWDGHTRWLIYMVGSC